MPIPKFNDLFNDILELLSDKKEYKTRDVKEIISNKLDLTDEERQELIPSGAEPIIKNRIGWSLTSLKKAGYVESKKWGSVNITELGLYEYKNNPNITIEDLMKIPSYQEYMGTDSKSNDNSDDDVIESSIDSTPEETIEKAYKTINNQLSDQILENILNNDPYFFEKLVVDLLLKMGYGEFRENAGITTSASNDGGIDGIINEDVLGLDKIGIQAKRFAPDNVIGRPMLQSFAGALFGKGLTKGVFITTSSFTQGAIDFVKNQSGMTIILIDGKKLTNLMIKYELGTFTIHNYPIKQIDSDYFNIGD